MTVLGIDPGIEGGWAVLTEAGGLIAAGDLPVSGEGAKRMVSAPLFADIVREHQATRAIIESVNAMPKQGVSSSFRFGKAAGVIEGVIGALGVPTSFVASTVWKRAMNLPGAEKEPSRQRALQEWPGHASLFARKKDHGRAEAALLALHSIQRNARP